eukprot:3133078-Rhodomonas_salina.2
MPGRTIRSISTGHRITGAQAATGAKSSPSQSNSPSPFPRGTAAPTCLARKDQGQETIFVEPFVRKVRVRLVLRYGSSHLLGE